MKMGEEGRRGTRDGRWETGVGNHDAGAQHWVIKVSRRKITGTVCYRVSQ